LSRIERSQLDECLIQDDHLALSWQHGSDTLVQTDPDSPARTFGRVTLARMIDEHLPHGVRRDAEEMSAVLPDDPILPNESHIRFVNQRSRLQRVLSTLAPQICGRSATKFLVHDRHKVVACLEVTTAPCPQQTAN